MCFFYDFQSNQSFLGPLLAPEGHLNGYLKSLKIEPWSPVALLGTSDCFRDVLGTSFFITWGTFGSHFSMIWGASKTYLNTGCNKNEIFSNDSRDTIRGPAAEGEALKILYT